MRKREAESGFLYNAAGQSFPGVACRLAPVVIGILVDDHRFADGLLRPKGAGEEAHIGVALV